MEHFTIVRDSIGGSIRRVAPDAICLEDTVSPIEGAVFRARETLKANGLQHEGSQAAASFALAL